jgi:hypothetical protein
MHKLSLRAAERARRIATSEIDSPSTVTEITRWTAPFVMTHSGFAKTIQIDRGEPTTDVTAAVLAHRVQLAISVTTTIRRNYPRAIAALPAMMMDTIGCCAAYLCTDRTAAMLKLSQYLDRGDGSV